VNGDYSVKFPLDDIKKYRQQLNEYQIIVSDIYTKTTASEKTNMRRLSGEIEIAYMDKYNEYPDGYSVNYARFVEKYFQSNFEYSLTADNTKGNNTALGTFLFDNKSGWCTYFAVAMTEYMRTVGVPARVSTGFIADNMTFKDGKYVKELTEENAHAWVELYYPNVGWLPFNPTAGGFDGSNFNNTEPPVTTAPVGTTIDTTDEGDSSVTTSLTVTTSNMVTETTDISGTTSVTTDVNGSIITEGNEDTKQPTRITWEVIIPIVTVLVILAAIITVLYRLYRLVTRREKQARTAFTKLKAGKPSRKRAVQCYSLIVRVLKQYKLKRGKTELFVLFAKRVSEYNIQVAKPAARIEGADDFKDITFIFEKLEYSSETLDGAESYLLGVFAEELYDSELKKHRLKILYKIALFLL
jgi:hypothetical protein